MAVTVQGDKCDKSIWCGSGTPWTPNGKTESTMTVPRYCMGFKQWLNEDGDLNSFSTDIGGGNKKPMHLKDPLKMPPADATGKAVEKGFGVRRRPKPTSKLLVANDKPNSSGSNIHDLPMGES